MTQSTSLELYPRKMLQVAAYQLYCTLVWPDYVLAGLTIYVLQNGLCRCIVQCIMGCKSWNGQGVGGWNYLYTFICVTLTVVVYHLLLISCLLFRLILTSSIW